MIQKGWMAMIGFLTVALLAVGMLALSGDSGSGSDPGEEVTEDDRAYAADYGVSVAEAQRRLGLQDDAGDLSASLVADEAATFGGLWVRHEPDFRVVVGFTEDGESTIRPHVEDGPLADIVETRTAAVALNTLVNDQGIAMNAVSGLGVGAESGINVFENRVELYVLDKATFDEALQKANIVLPGTVLVLEVAEFSSPDVDIYGGLALSRCTSGFGVKDSSGTKGITTAGHCYDTLHYDGLWIPHQEGTFQKSHDVQWHTAPDFTVKNKIKVGTNTRSITSTRSRNSQSVGNYVCKYGKTTGYTCGNIVDKNFQFTDERSDCDDPGNCQWKATWIKVHKDGVNLSEGGDSGGPWFSKYTAYGTHSRSLGDDAFYMAINYVDAIDITVLTE
ncbi:MAG: S1 family peptidase [Chloroflexi bacterium]|nr:S1 family peptidase [Chloroflexota bacterium]